MGLNFNAENPVGVCYTSGGGTPPPATDSDVHFVLANANNQRLASAPCTLGKSSCTHNGRTGSCKFVGLEPRRVFTVPSQFAATHNALVKEVVTTVYSKPPPRRVNTDGGDGVDGTDGVGCCQR